MDSWSFLPHLGMLILKVSELFTFEGWESLVTLVSATTEASQASRSISIASTCQTGPPVQGWMSSYDWFTHSPPARGASLESHPAPWRHHESLRRLQVPHHARLVRRFEGREPRNPEIGWSSFHNEKLDLPKDRLLSSRLSAKSWRSTSEFGDHKPQNSAKRLWLEISPKWIVWEPKKWNLRPNRTPSEINHGHITVKVGHVECGLYSKQAQFQKIRCREIIENLGIPYIPTCGCQNDNVLPWCLIWVHVGCFVFPWPRKVRAGWMNDLLNQWGPVDSHDN